MSILIKNATLRGEKRDVLIEGNKIEKIAKSIEANATSVIEADGMMLLPAFVDMHTHLREPGFSGKETIETGARAAVAGGYASVCCMPNTKPIIDNECIVKYIKERAREVGLVKVYPIGAATLGSEGKLLAEIGKMRDAGIVAVTDDGVPVENACMMKNVMAYASDFKLKVTSHCEDKSLADGGVVNAGRNATVAGLRGICRSSEEVMVAREIILADTLGVPVHIAHISTKGSVRLIRDAKKNKIAVTAETCPHYFSATDEAILNYDTNAKVNPPLREESDRLAIIEGLKDGTIDAIATDHAPHKSSDKACEFDLAANGISGIETAYSLAYTVLVKSGIITLAKLVELMTKNPAKIFNLSYGKTVEGGLADLVLVDNNTKFKIDKNEFFSKGKNTPFDGREVWGKVNYTIVEGKIKYAKGEIEK